MSLGWKTLRAALFERAVTRLDRAPRRTRGDYPWVIGGRAQSQSDVRLASTDMWSKPGLSQVGTNAPGG